MHPSEIWHGDSVSAKLARIALAPASWIYALGWETYLAAYRLGLKKPSEPHRPVVCIGNLVSGGSGKTPVTVYLARLLQELGHSVVISANGYGSPASEGAALAPDGELDHTRWGDEPALLRTLLPGVPLVVGRRRVLAAEVCHREYPKSVMLMDDGFQHLPLRKHISIVLDPDLPRNPLCLPAGPYREPRWNRSRADLVLPGRYKVVRSPLRFFTPSGEERKPSAYSILCAIGQPDQFECEVAHVLGSAPIVKRFLPDHDPLTEGNLPLQLPAGSPVVVTAKDWVKLKSHPRVNERQFLVARQEVRIEPGDDFRAWISARLDEFTQKTVDR